LALVVLLLARAYPSLSSTKRQGATGGTSGSVDPAQILGAVLTKDGQSASNQLHVAALVNELTQHDGTKGTPGVPRDPQAGAHLRLVSRIPCGATEGLDAIEIDLNHLLCQVAIEDEVMVAITDRNILSTWIPPFVEQSKRAQVDNLIIVALDDESKTAIEGLGVPCWRFNKEALVSEEYKKIHGANGKFAVSGMKFRILRYFLKLGVSVLLTDVDVAVLQNPFNFLYRDSDIEVMSDGFDDDTAYGKMEGYHDPSMGWAQWAYKHEVFASNSGLFYARSTHNTIAAMDEVTRRLEASKGWDQNVFNEVIWLPSRKDYRSPQTSVRVMDIHLFMNTKTLFKKIRRQRKMCSHTPVMVHINYHPDKFPRMKAVVDRYIFKKMDALDKFTDGSEPDGTDVKTCLCC